MGLMSNIAVVTLYFPLDIKNAIRDVVIVPGWHLSRLQRTMFPSAIEGIVREGIKRTSVPVSSPPWLG